MEAHGMNLTDFDVLSFDCYGTLIDWEAGIWESLQPWMTRVGLDKGQDEILRDFAEAEAEAEADHVIHLYPVILESVLWRLAGRYGVAATDADATAFGMSAGDWPAFPDSTPALRYLKEHYKLVILSNVDNASFAKSNEKLAVEFDAVYTAEDIQSYKPNRRNFIYMLDRLAEMGIDKSRVLHLAQSLFHDHIPAKGLGLATAWIDRRHGMKGAGAAKEVAAEIKPDFYAQSMADFAEQHRAAVGGTD